MNNLELALTAAQSRRDKEAEARFLQAYADMAKQHADQIQRLTDAHAKEYQTECRKLEGQ